MSIFERVERFLWRRGFVQPALRAATRDLFIFSAIFFGLGAALLPWTLDGLWAGVAALLSAWNFFINSALEIIALCCRMAQWNSLNEPGTVNVTFVLLNVART